MTPALWLAVALGLTAGIGLWSVTIRLPTLGRPRLAARLAPQLLDVSAEARRVVRPPVVDPIPVLGVVAAPALDLFQRAFGALLGSSGGVAVRLARAGRAWSLEGYRLRQLLWAVAGGAAGTGLGALVAAQGSPAALVAAPVVGAMIGPLLRDRLLVAEGARRAARIESELPTVLEFLALSLSAGEGIHDAIRRTARVGSGALADLLGRVADEVAVGVPLPTVLVRVGDELRIPALTRALTHVVGALDRGSPLAEVLRVQAADARDQARRVLLEAAGRKEIGMIPPRGSCSRRSTSEWTCRRPLDEDPSSAIAGEVTNPEGTHMTDNERTAAVDRFRKAVRRAIDWTSPDLKPEAVKRERLRRLEAARAELRRFVPGEADASDSADRVARFSAAALAGLEAKDANTVAVAQNEWAKLQRSLGDEKQHLDQLIRTASRPRLTAIIDRLEDLVAESADPEGASREVREAVVARLADLGDARASEALSEAEEGASEAAWGAYIAETLERGDASYNASAALYRADPDAHAALVDADPPTPGLDLPTAIRRTEQAGAAVSA